MARLTKIRANQTRAADAYTADNNNLATDGEVEQRVRKHSELFHHNRDDKTVFTYDVNGNLSKLEIYADDNISLLQETSYTYLNNSILQIVKEVWDADLLQYLKLQKDFIYNASGNIISIQNTKI